MILISHRGNLIGPDPKRENSISYIQEALDKGYNVEIDIWVENNKLWLGHDLPQYFVNKMWLVLNKKQLWIHCKNIEAINYFSDISLLKVFNYFWHENDTLTLTSKNYIWAYPGKQPIKNSIAIMPEINNDDISQCLGVCSNYIQNYKK